MEKLGLKEFIINCVVNSDFRNSYLANPDKFFADNPNYALSGEEKKQLKAFKISDWDSMELKDLNEWLTQAGEISRPVSVSVGIP
jgi:hypothetical protein